MWRSFRVICAGDVPDHTTIARFRQAHVDRFGAVFAQVLGLCARAGMGRLATVAIDGTKIAANAAMSASHDAEWFGKQARRITQEAAAVDAAEDAEFGEGVRGDEVPAELADPKTRSARIAQILAELEAEQAQADAAAADKQAQAEQHLARLAAGPVTGRDPGGVDPVAAAQARLARELVARQAELDAYAARVATAQAEGHRLPRGRRVTDPQGGKRVKKALAALDRTREQMVTATAGHSGKTGKTGKTGNVAQRNLTDPDSRILPIRQGWVQGYNAQLSVSADWLILVAELTNTPADTEQFQPMPQRTVQAAELINSERKAVGGERETLGTALADAGYCSEDNLTAPGPDRLIATGKAHHVHNQARTNPTTDPPPPDTTPTEAMRHRLRTPHGAQLYKKRAATVETVNGHLKDRIGLRRFSMRGLDACRGELNLAALVHNLRRMFTLTPTTPLQAV